MVTRTYTRRAVLGAATLIGGGGLGLVAGRAGWPFHRGGSDSPWNASSFAGPYEKATSSPTYDQSSALFAEELSVHPGDVLTLRGRAPHRVDVAVFRAGWKAADAPILSRIGIDIRAGNSPAAQWPIVLQTPIDFTWVSGLYVAAIRAQDDHRKVRFAPFVVRSAAPVKRIVVQVPFATYHAYNGWGGASFYSYNSPKGVAASMSTRRPFDVFNGAGFMFYGDWPFARWLDREGYEAAFVTSFDLHNDPHLLQGTKLFVSAFHDEYWSTPMRRHLERFIASGGNAAFFGANSMFWRVRLDGQMMTCRKALKAADDQASDITAQWRSALIGEPENGLIGSSYEDYVDPYGTRFDWKVTAPDHWVYEGTNLKLGDTIAGLVGYEWDNTPDPKRPGLTVLASNNLTKPSGAIRRHDATYLTHPTGGSVLNVGTTYWPRYLLGDTQFRNEPLVEQMTRNVLRRMAPSI